MQILSEQEALANGLRITESIPAERDVLGIAVSEDGSVIEVLWCPKCRRYRNGTNGRFLAAEEVEGIVRSGLSDQIEEALQRSGEGCPAVTVNGKPFLGRSSSVQYTEGKPLDYDDWLDYHPEDQEEEAKARPKGWPLESRMGTPAYRRFAKRHKNRLERRRAKINPEVPPTYGYF